MPKVKDPISGRGLFKSTMICLRFACAEFEGQVQRAPANDSGGQENNPKQTDHNGPEAADHRKGQGQKNQAQHDPEYSISITYI
jgi:hypothetical protein